MANSPKKLNLALQGGGAQGAFTWGVLDQLLLDERVEIEAISGTSAGAVNGVLVAYGLMSGGRDTARALLHQFWRKVSIATEFSPFRPSMFDKFMGNYDLRYSPSFMAMEYMSRLFSPYQLNILDINPLQEILNELIDFDRVKQCKKLRLFVNATNVHTGKPRVFNTHELSVEAVMASACLPLLFKTVWVDGEPYWDGGYSGNPAIYPLIYHCGTRDVMLVQINPLKNDDVPTGSHEILDRLNEINFNASLMSEMRAIEFVSRLKKQGKLGDEYKDMRIHMIEAQEILSEFGRMSKLNTDWDFLSYLYDTGVQAASDWLDSHYEAIGQQSTVNLRDMFL